MSVARSPAQPIGQCAGEGGAIRDGFPLTPCPTQFRGEPPPLVGIDITRFEQPGYFVDRLSAVGGADRLGCGRQRETSKRKRKQGTYHSARSFLIRSPKGRSEARRVGKECVSKCRTRGSPYNYKKKKKEL